MKVRIRFEFATSEGDFMKKVLAKAACVAFVFVTGLAFVACPNNVNGPSPSSSEETPAAERLDEPVGAENPFRGKKYLYSRYSKYVFKNSDDRIVEVYSQASSGSEFELTREDRYTYNTDDKTLTFAVNKVRTSPITDEAVEEAVQYARAQCEYDYATIKGENATRPGTYGGVSSSDRVLYTYAEYKAGMEKYVGKILPVYDEYIAKYEALLNDPQYENKKTEIETKIASLKDSKASSSVDSVMGGLFGTTESYKYEFKDGKLLLVEHKPNFTFGKDSFTGVSGEFRFNVQCSNGRPAYFYIGGSRSGGWSVYSGFAIANGTISGTRTYSSYENGVYVNKTEDFSLTYTTSGSGDDTKVKISFANAPDSLKSVVGNASELEFTYSPTPMELTEITE